MNNTQHTSQRADELSISLSQFIAEVMRYDSDEMLRLLKREDLSMPRVGALNVVARRGAVSISDISVCLGLSLANTSMLVDKLVCTEFVTRVEDASDRRQKLIRLTEKGRMFVSEVQTTRVNQVVQRMLLLPPELLDRTIAVLADVTTQLADSPERDVASRSDIVPRL
ncbi:MAG: winged helix DNA-binding protein [Roseiflexaceae bacterium]|nr:winged helix DNA-binding protein [Roseiflexaceae bacterium]